MTWELGPFVVQNNLLDTTYDIQVLLFRVFVWVINFIFFLYSIWIFQKTNKEETIYLGPHGAPPLHSKQQEVNSSGRKQRFKQKLKEADRKISGVGRENKVENLRELVGSGGTADNMSKSSPRDWLDPHCHESQFEKWQ